MKVRRADVLNELAQEIPDWQLPPEDAKHYDPPLNDDQLKWFNRGVLSVRDMVVEKVKGNL